MFELDGGQCCCHRDEDEESCVFDFGLYEFVSALSWICIDNGDLKLRLVGFQLPISMCWITIWGKLMLLKLFLRLLCFNS